METTGYLYFASTEDINEHRQIETSTQSRLNWNRWKLSSHGIMRFLPVLLTLTIVGIADQALAARFGDRGAEVTYIQRCLKQIGVYDGPVTGYFGPQTQAAVKRFQTQNRIQAIGVVGPQTTAALRRRCSANNSTSGGLRVGSRGNEVLRLQQNLRQLKFYDGPVTGYFGTQTQAAVIRFQNAYRLRADGIAGTRTLATINNQLIARRNPVPTIPPNPSIGDEYPDALNMGDRSPFVTRLQDDLRTAGYFNRNSTGYFGPVTRDAVARFQRERGLFATGVADRQTLLTLSDFLRQNSGNITNPNDNACSPNSGNICLGERSQRVVLVQQRLAQWGFLRGNIDGLYGNGTRDAVLQFQRYSGLSATGIVDFQTWQALRLNDGSANNNITPRKSSYIVAIPMGENGLLERVQQFVPQAQPDKSRKGDFVNAGAFSNRSDAERLTRQLRDRGFDARVDYIN